MSKDKKGQPGAGSSDTMINQLPQTTPQAPPSEEDKREPFMPTKMTAGQYLKRQPQGAGISGLIRSLYSTKVMSFEEWENTVKTLLKKQVK